jgi:hypothetical protein
VRLGALIVGVTLLFPAAASSGETGPSMGGTTGLINVPTADVLREGALQLGYRFVDKEWAYVARGVSRSDVYFFALGFLPRTEVAIRATVFPQTEFLEESPSSGPQADRMASGRVLLLPQAWYPAVAVGLDDPHGNRNFHSLYAVATRGISLCGGECSVDATLGYGFRVFDAERYILDGGFGGVRGSYGESASLMLEYDTEKWNAGSRIALPFHLAILAVLLDLDVISGGVSWSHSF